MQSWRSTSIDGFLMNQIVCMVESDTRSLMEGEPETARPWLYLACVHWVGYLNFNHER